MLFSLVVNKQPKKCVSVCVVILSGAILSFTFTFTLQPSDSNHKDTDELKERKKGAVCTSDANERGCKVAVAEFQ